MISQESILSFLELETHDHIWDFSIPVGVPDVKRVIHIGVPYITEVFFLGNWLNKMNGK